MEIPLVFEHDLSINRIIVPNAADPPNVRRCEDLSEDGKDNIDPILGTEIPDDRLVRVIAGETVRCYDINSLKIIVKDAEDAGNIPKDPFVRKKYTDEQINWIKSIPSEMPEEWAVAREAGNRERRRAAYEYERGLYMQNDHEEEEEDNSLYDIGIDPATIAVFNENHNNNNNNGDFLDRTRTNILQRHPDSIIWKILVYDAASDNYDNHGMIPCIFQNTLNPYTAPIRQVSDEKYASAQFKMFRFLMDQMNIRGASEGVAMVLKHFYHFFNVHESPSFLKFCNSADVNTRSIILRLIEEMFDNYVAEIIRTTPDLIFFLKTVNLCLISMRMSSIKRDYFWFYLLKRWLTAVQSDIPNSLLYAFYKSGIFGGGGNVFADWLLSFFMYEYIPSVTEDETHIYSSLSRPEALSRIFRGKYDLLYTIFYDNTYALKFHLVKDLHEHLFTMFDISEEGHDLYKLILNKRPSFVKNQNSQIQNGPIEKKIFATYDRLDNAHATTTDNINKLKVRPGHTEEDVFMECLEQANSNWVLNISKVVSRFDERVEHKSDFVKEQMMFLVSTYNITKKFMTPTTSTNFILSYIDNMVIGVSAMQYLPYSTIVHDLFISVIKKGSDDNLKAIFNPNHYELLQGNLYRHISTRTWKTIFKYLLIIRKQSPVIKNIQRLLIEQTDDIERYTYNWKDVNDLCFENMQPKMIFLQKYMQAVPNNSNLKLETLKNFVLLFLAKVRESPDDSRGDASVEQESVDCIKLICSFELPWHFEEDETDYESKEEEEEEEDDLYERLIDETISSYNESCEYNKRPVNKYSMEIFAIVKASTKRRR